MQYTAGYLSPPGKILLAADAAGLGKTVSYGMIADQLAKQDGRKQVSARAALTALRQKSGKSI